ncbi:hypothetical protein HanIR_Chr04g0154671 [Helianthus annuus]|nr:hypothetical protein HanIR_Chr04g0154671 [Helianthus annuus]
MLGSYIYSLKNNDKRSNGNQILMCIDVRNRIKRKKPRKKFIQLIHTQSHSNHLFYTTELLQKTPHTIQDLPYSPYTIYYRNNTPSFKSS